MTPKHYLRFIQALALTAALPACAGSTESLPTTEAGTQSADAQDDSALVTLGHDAGPAADAATEVDAGRPFSSGPVVPPELPAGFA